MPIIRGFNALFLDINTTHSTCDNTSELIKRVVMRFSGAPTIGEIECIFLYNTHLVICYFRFYLLGNMEKTPCSMQDVSQFFVCLLLTSSSYLSNICAIFHQRLLDKYNTLFEKKQGRILLYDFPHTTVTVSTTSRLSGSISILLYSGTIHKTSDNTSALRISPF